MTRMTRERRAVLEHLAGGEEVTPSQLADAMGRGRGSTRELLRQMARDGLLVSLNNTHQTNVLRLNTATVKVGAARAAVSQNAKG